MNMSIPFSGLRQSPLTVLAGMVLALCSACGGSGLPSQPPSPPPPPAITLVAGSTLLSDTGSADGNGSAARFYGPAGLAFDAAGVLYVADTHNHTIRKISTSGQVSTVAGVVGGGYQDGPAAQARFQSPKGLAFDAAGNLYIADMWNLKIRKLTPSGIVSTYASIPVGDNVDNRSFSIQTPQDLAVDAAGNVYATNGVGTRKIAPNGALTILEGANTRDNMMGTAASFRSAIAVDGDGQVFIGRGAIVKVSPQGSATVLAGSFPPGSEDGTGSAAHFQYHIAGLVLDRSGNLYAADTANQTIRKITPAGVVTTIAGRANLLIPGSTPPDTVLGPFPGSMTPNALALGPDGALYTTSSNAIIRVPLP